MKIDKKCKLEKLVVSPNDRRPALENPHFNKKDSLVVATNGRALAIVPVEKSTSGDDCEGAIPVDALKASRKVSGQLSIDQATAIVAGVSYPRPSIQFPDYQQVLPKYKAGDAGTISLGFDAHLLADLVDALGCSSGMVTLTLPLDDGRVDYEAPARIDPDSPAHRDAYGVLMMARTKKLPTTPRH